MILVDTSVWIDHLRSGNPRLARELDAGRVLMHPYVLGEIALGSLRHRDEVLRLLGGLPSVVTGTELEVLQLIESTPLAGRGIGYVDAALLAATRLTPGARLWTQDRWLRAVADELGVGTRGL